MVVIVVMPRALTSSHTWLKTHSHTLPMFMTMPMVVMVIIVLMGFAGWQWLTGDQGLDGGDRRSLAGGDDFDAPVSQAVEKTGPAAAGNEDIQLVHRVFVTPEFVHGHFLGQVNALNLHPIAGLVASKDQKTPGLACVAGNGAEVLAGDPDTQLAVAQSICFIKPHAAPPCTKTPWLR